MVSMGLEEELSFQSINMLDSQHWDFLGDDRRSDSQCKERLFADAEQRLWNIVGRNRQNCFAHYRHMHEGSNLC